MPYKVEVIDLEDIIINDTAHTDKKQKVFFRIKIKQEELEKIPFNKREISLLIIYEDLTSILTEYEVNYMERKKDDVFYVFINRIKKRIENSEEAKPWVREMQINNILKD